MANRAVQALTPLTTWGKHMILDAARCNPASIRSSAHIHNFTKCLVSAIDMKAWGPPQIVMFGTGNKKGYTLVQLIETSNICAHFTEEDDSMYLDVFSCKDFAPETVDSVVSAFFAPVRTRSSLLLRDAPGRGGSTLPPSPPLRLISGLSQSGSTTTHDGESWLKD